ncbi:MAG TPA: hypothetical protein VGP61_03385, partial [Gemmatimonadales bacterium]|nr:hypothetical protein [Gemmatimonadales bacterium]
MSPSTVGQACCVLVALLLTGCAGRVSLGATPLESGGLPPVPEVHGPLRLSVVYPDSLARIEVEDSSFVFGSVGDGSALLRLNGTAVPVARNGAWLAWIPFRGDSIVTLLLEARTASDSARLEYHVRHALRFVPPPTPLW